MVGGLMLNQASCMCPTDVTLPLYLSLGRTPRIGHSYAVAWEIGGRGGGQDLWGKVQVVRGLKVRGRI